ncbi:MAG: two component transcriptional regulator, winged helix family [Fluviicola sp.]|jgi:two-component system alkaline phosphatase synthesis response regulator PhoP|uniref:response regulator transcription factor n=1 Tax=Fluviicola sp. TaxID=1917219 RepID=UPI0026279333|nr:response regulator transcription factor [Fluviicola sp.]MDF3029279.1 two component transcriptional regulator, winged helix family [Fluviicola sp.]
MDKVLVIEDEQSLLEMIQFNLELEGYSVTTINNGREALAMKNQLDNYDLVILDVMLPEVSGLDICRAYREVSTVPIIFISAKGNTIDRVAGLKLGANDYLPKPFDLEEFILRCSVLVQPNKKQMVLPSEIKIGNYRVLPASFEVENMISGEKQELSKREMELIQLFYLKKDQVVSRDEILTTLWTNDQFPTGRTIDNYILSFRKLFEEDPKNPQFFHSIRGVGYKFTLLD